jgi:hypothetical protein
MEGAVAESTPASEPPSPAPASPAPASPAPASPASPNLASQGPPPPRLPRVTDLSLPNRPFVAARPANPMFGLLVRDEADVVGLLAYALSKQQRRDWQAAWQAREGRSPTESESDIFILGESIPRRIAAYRQSAEHMLAAHRATAVRSSPGGPASGSGGAPDAATAQAAVMAAARKPVTWRYIAFMLVMLVAMAVVFRLAAAYLFGPAR